jgi:PTS system glucose-specific IIC component
VPQPETVQLRDPAAAEKALSFIRGLGSARNIKQVDAVAGTRLRVVVGNEGQVNEPALQAAGVNGIMRLPNRILHLIVGPNADQYAAEMAGGLA